MGGIHFEGVRLLESFTEIVGFKCGIALDREQLFDALRRIGQDRFAKLTPNSYVRLHSSEYEEIIYDLLKLFGRLDESFNGIAVASFWHRYRHDARMLGIFDSVLESFTNWMKAELEAAMKRSEKIMNLERVMKSVFAKHGEIGLDMLIELIKNMNAQLVASPWSSIREEEWKNQLDLKNLFMSEGLDAAYGRFIDQRYIDYLNVNFDQVDKMNWRKFEQLSAEFLDRQGYHVELGPGRGDDGVDVRAWDKNDDSSAPLVIVQCKRTKNNVEKAVIKSLYADVLHEKALSGLIVSTSRLSPGAAATKMARCYPVEVADRDSLRTWLLAMRRPGAGFLSK